MNIDRRPLAMLATGAATISLAPVLVKLAALWGSIGPSGIALWRCAFGAMMLASLAIALRQRLLVRGRLAWLLGLAGITFAVDLTVWHHSIFLAGAGMATILGNTQVFFTALLAMVFFGERLTLRFVTAAGFALAGLVLLVGIGSDVRFSADYLRGVGFGLATGVAYAVFLTLLRAAARSGEQVSPVARLGWISAVAALALAGPAAASGDAVPDSALGWVALVLLALIAQAFGWWCISTSVSRVPAAIAGLVLLTQPVLATVWSVLLFGEALSALQVVGALITLAAVYTGSMRA